VTTTAVVGEIGDDAVDLLLGADVDALGGLGQQQQLGSFDELSGEHHLLCVAAGKRSRARRRTRGADVEMRHLVDGEGTNGAAVEDAMAADRSTR
jgi:hypothetical protein